MRVFLTGATGYLGSAVLDAILRAGHPLMALVRDPEKAAQVTARGASAIVGELGTPASYEGALESCDAVVHTAFEDSPRGVDKDRDAIAAFIAALNARSAQTGASPVFIYTSGIWVLGATSRPADETAPLAPAEHVSWRPAHERRVLDAGDNGVRTIVVRPGIVYGGTRGIVSDLVRDALNGVMRVVGPGKNRWPTVYDRDLGDLYVRLLQAPDARGIYHANDDAEERVNEIVEAIADHLTQRPDIRHMPLPEARRKLGPYADALALDQRVRSPRAKALGWAPTLSSVTGSVPRLFEEFRARRR
ncbi:MAG: NAD-dependent epimerase/dehydratase family protein [Acidobacteriota bacterium]